MAAISCQPTGCKTAEAHPGLDGPNGDWRVRGCSDDRSSRCIQPKSQVPNALDTQMAHLAQGFSRRSLEFNPDNARRAEGLKGRVASCVQKDHVQKDHER